MNNTKADIISRLQKEIMPLQGFKPVSGNTGSDVLGLIKGAFPNQVFPVGAIHEFICGGEEDISASAGFISGILSSIMKIGGISIWISRSQNIFPPALKSFGIEPDRIIFIELQKEKEILWVMEEALKCEGLAAVIGETPDLSFTASRRLQLAVEQSRVTGFVIRRNPANLATTSVSRWKITPLPSDSDGLPGLGFPQWNVELLKIRNGTPGKWKMEWAGRFRHIFKLSSIRAEEQRKTG